MDIDYKNFDFNNISYTDHNGAQIDMPIVTSLIKAVKLHEGIRKWMASLTNEQLLELQSWETGTELTRKQILFCVLSLRANELGSNTVETTPDDINTMIDLLGVMCAHELFNRQGLLITEYEGDKLWGFMDADKVKITMTDKFFDFSEWYCKTDPDFENKFGKKTKDRIESQFWKK